MLFQKPSDESIRGFLNEQANLPFSYLAVGDTAHKPPDGFVVDRTRLKLGEGEQMFQLAKTALQRWHHFKLGWIDVWPPESPIQTGQVLAVLGQALGLWWLNACRIVYVTDDSSKMSNYGFAYGTLPGHAESGEERFMIEWDRADNFVWYDIMAFSRPNQFLIRMGYPLVRRMQKQFGRDSAKAMFNAFGEVGKLPAIQQASS